ncbi:MAG: hypothetical protein R6U91_09235 [Bacillota bacterium]
MERFKISLFLTWNPNWRKNSGQPVGEKGNQEHPEGQTDRQVTHDEPNSPDHSGQGLIKKVLFG